MTKKIQYWNWGEQWLLLVSRKHHSCYFVLQRFIVFIKSVRLLSPRISFTFKRTRILWKLNHEKSFKDFLGGHHATSWCRKANIKKVKTGRKISIKKHELNIHFNISREWKFWRNVFYEWEKHKNNLNGAIIHHRNFTIFKARRNKKVAVL